MDRLYYLENPLEGDRVVSLHSSLEKSANVERFVFKRQKSKQEKMKEHAIIIKKDKVKAGRNAACRKDRQQSADWSFPGSPLDLACTFLLTGLTVGQFRGPVLTGCLGRRFVDALLHPLHDQVEQGYHRLVHLGSGCCTCLEIRDSVSNKNCVVKKSSTDGCCPLHSRPFYPQIIPSSTPYFALKIML